jgi:cobalt/nickel transport system permease protein
VHIPDNFLDVPTAAATSVVAAGGVGYALHRLKGVYQERTAPLMGVMGACVFAGQMVNFPVLGGTSGHLCGGVLAAAVLGPWGGAVTMAVVLAVQCLVFGDGGLTALGANVLNLALVGSVGGYCVYSLLRRFAQGNPGVVVAAVIASWFSVILSATICSLELAASGTYPLQPALSAMLFVHAFIGLGEATITGLSLAFILRTRPDMIYDVDTSTKWQRSVQVVVGGLAVAMVVAVLVSPFASSFPDGLEKVAENPGFTPTDNPTVVESPIPDYEVPGVSNLTVAGSLAGFIGTLIVFAIALAIGRMVQRSGVPTSSLHAA